MERLAAKIVLLWGWPRALAAFCSGALAVLALAPFDFPAVAFVSFTVLVWLLDGATGTPNAGFFNRIRPAFATGWWFGFGYFVAGLWWIGNALLVEADAFAWALPLAIVGLPAVLALFFAAACVLARLWWRDGPSRVAALAVAFALAELARASWFTGFPWNPVGFTLAPVPFLMQSTSIVGIAGLNAMAVFIYAMPAILVSRRFLRTGAVATIGLALVHAGYGLVRLSVDTGLERDTLAVRIVQPSIKQTEKWSNDQRGAILDLLLEMTGRQVNDGEPARQLVVWPETAVPYLLTERPEVLSSIGETLTEEQVLFTGAVRVEGGDAGTAGRYYNSLVAINDGGEIAEAADKLHLVPFGEYLPFAEQLSDIGLSRLVEGPGGFSQGSSRTLLGVPGGRMALPFICYEIIFSTDEPAARNAALAVNVTNDAWYGLTPGPYQHLRHSQVRAVELGLPVLRAANNGVSAAIDPKGRIVDALNLDVRDNLDVEIQLGRVPTLYAEKKALPAYGLLATFTLFSLFTGLIQRFRRN